MTARHRIGFLLVSVQLLAIPTASDAAEPGKFLSHPPTRSVPLPADRPRTAGPAYFVDRAGDDAHDGAEKSPWKTINHALKQLKAGDTLYLRGGVYYENVYCAVAGKPDSPIVIRSYPKEQAVIDGGLSEFQDAPATAWTPHPEGSPDEYRSTRSFKNIRDVVGLFGDSFIGLQTYWHTTDLRAKNELWIDDPAQEQMVLPHYCGPGLWYDKQSGHIHVRLAHTHLQTPGLANYQGETDPRKLPLVVAPFSSVPLFVDQAMHVKFQDLVVRGGGVNAVVLQMGIDLEFDNVTIFAGTYGLRSRSTGPLKIVNSAIHGMIPPWAWRSENGLYTYTPQYYDPFISLPAKSNARNISRLPTHALLVTEGSYEFEVFYYPYNHDWEISQSEFTDGHDGVYLSGRNIRFHHNWVDSVQDDAIYLSSPAPYFNDNIHIFQNLITRSLMSFSCNSSGGSPGTISIYRNIVDLRRGVHVGRPSPMKPQGDVTSYHIFLTHGRELLGIESLHFYQNTFISNAMANSFAHRTWVNTFQTTNRRVFNNLCIYLNAYPSLDVVSAPDHDIQLDGNLHWCVAAGVSAPADFLTKVQTCRSSQFNKAKYAPGWSANDVVADPKFTLFDPAPASPADYRLLKDSPAIGQGIVLPDALTDPLRPAAGARPDIGALPLGAESPRFGRAARITFPISLKP